jgi:hypothetical protein
MSEEGDEENEKFVHTATNVFRSLTVRRADVIRDIVSGMGWFAPLLRAKLCAKRLENLAAVHTEDQIRFVVGFDTYESPVCVDFENIIEE